MLKKDQYWFGALVGILFPLLFFGFVWALNYFLILLNIAKMYFDLKTHILVSMVANVLPIRYYFVNLKYDKTGRGILLFTFVLILFFFALKDKLLEIL